VVIVADDPSPIKVPHGAVSDINDVASIMPRGGLGVGGATGIGHSRTYVIEDKYNAFVNPVKIFAAAIVDLLYDGAKIAQEVIDEYEPRVSKEGYMDYWHDILN
jgi:hypothetical protein